MKEEREAKYWNRKWKLRDQHLRERVVLDGSDGEEEFDRELRRKVRGKRVLDVGCGPGESMLSLARIARSIIGVDSSKVALSLARRNLSKNGVRNAEFRSGDAASELRPCSLGSSRSHLHCSRRGHAQGNRTKLEKEGLILRVLNLIVRSFNFMRSSESVRHGVRPSL